MNLRVANINRRHESRSFLMTSGDRDCGAGCFYCGLRLNGAAALEARDLAGWLRSGRQPKWEIELITAGYPGCTGELCRLVGDFKRGGVKTVAVCFGPGAGKEEVDFAALASAGVDEIAFSLTATSRNMDKGLRPCRDGCPDWWDACWGMAEAALGVFGTSRVAFNLGLGLGETEQSVLQFMQKADRLGIRSRVSPLSVCPGPHNKPVVSRGKFLRVLAGLHVLSRKLAVVEQMQFGDFGQVIHFGLAPERFRALVAGGEAFDSAYCYVDCANFGQPPASEAGMDGGGDEMLSQLCTVDWEEAWTTQRKFHQIDELDFDDEEIEAESGSVYAMIAELGRNGFPK
jgi:hypothetical protein